jgi:alkylhydroperoxidase family enzyme
MASRAAGCRYCMAHTAGGALHMGVEERKLADIWDYQTSPLYSAAERVALDFALAAAQVPNAVTDELFAALRAHWNEEQIVEIVGTISLFGFMNRWNDTMATPLEDEPVEVGEKYLAAHGWDVGKHRGQ